MGAPVGAGAPFDGAGALFFDNVDAAKSLLFGRRGEGALCDGFEHTLVVELAEFLPHSLTCGISETPETCFGGHLCHNPAVDGSLDVRGDRDGLCRRLRGFGLEKGDVVGGWMIIALVVGWRIHDGG